jgi:hypothetical protein
MGAAMIGHSGAGGGGGGGEAKQRRGRGRTRAHLSARREKVPPAEPSYGPNHRRGNVSLTGFLG